MVLGSFAVHPRQPRGDKPVGDIRVAVDELVGRPGNVVVQFQGDPAGVDRAIVTTSPRFEAIIVLLVASVALVVAVVCGVDVVAGDARPSTLFGLTWALGWLALMIYRLWLQGRAFEHAIDAFEDAVGPADIRWTASRPKVSDRIGHGDR